MPSVDVDLEELTRFYDEQARLYCASLPLEHFMETTDAGTHRAITLSAFEQIAVVRPDIQCFNELLVQYPKSANLKDVTRVCPDNFVIIHDQPVSGLGSFNTPLQPISAFLVMEYVSKENQRKDYVDNRRRYQDDLEVPYYVLFRPDVSKLDLLQLVNGVHENVKPNGAGRLEIPELEIEVALLDGWLRFWFREKLLPLTGELATQLEQTVTDLGKTKTELGKAKSELTEAQQKLADAAAEIARLKAELAKRNTDT